MGAIDRLRRLAPDSAKDATVETLRGLACLLLVAYHVRGGDPTSGLRLDSSSPWAYAMDSLVYLRMPLFSFLSGVVYARRPVRSAYPLFVRGKARRLLIPLLVIGTSFAILQALTGAVDGSGTPPWYLWHIVPVAHFWFLESIFWVFLLVAALDRFRLLDRPFPGAVAILAAIAAETVVKIPENLLGLGTAFFLLPFFLSGVLSQRFRWRTHSPVWLRLSVIGIALALTTWSQLGLQGLVAPIPARDDATATILGITMCLSLLLVRWRVAPLMVIGSFSFTIYTCHVFATSATRMVLERFGVDSVSFNMVVGVTAGVLFGILVESVARHNAWSAAAVLGRRLPQRPGAGDDVRRGGAVQASSVRSR